MSRMFGRPMPGIGIRGPPRISPEQAKADEETDRREGVVDWRGAPFHEDPDRMDRIQGRSSRDEEERREAAH
jgi:hypothetical protein